jgi:hypothetical protein
MINELKIQELLFTYVDLILQCEGYIKKAYNLESIPYLNKDKIPKSGEVQSNDQLLEYNFHGSGCTFLLGSIELDYDIYLDRENYIVVSPWGVTRFVNSYQELGASITEIQAADWLVMLNSKGIVNKIFDNYLVYEVSFDWYHAIKNGNISK